MPAYFPALTMEGPLIPTSISVLRRNLQWSLRLSTNTGPGRLLDWVIHTVRQIDSATRSTLSPDSLRVRATYSISSLYV